MITQFLNTPEDFENQSKFNHDQYIDTMLSMNIDPSCFDNILDIGEDNPLCRQIRRQFSVDIDNTEGDLNWYWKAPKPKYDLILCSNVIEHIPNIMTFLYNISLRMAKNGYFFLAWPIRHRDNPHHYYEIPLDKITPVLKEFFYIEGTKVLPVEKTFPKGIRPLIKMFLDKNIYILLSKI